MKKFSAIYAGYRAKGNVFIAESVLAGKVNGALSEFVECCFGPVSV